MPRALSAVPYYGGKHNMLSTLIPLLEGIEHRIFVDVFGGSAKVILNKARRPVEVYNDIESHVVSFFRVISDPVQFEKFRLRVGLMCYSREEYNFCVEHADEPDDSIERVARWWYAARCGFSGRVAFNGHSNSYGFSRTSHCGMMGEISRYLSTIDRLQDIHERLQCVNIEHVDWRKCIKLYDTSETLFYCDPPYPRSTREPGGDRKDGYSYEMTDNEHLELIDNLNHIQGKAVLSGYPSDLYAPLDESGHRIVTVERSASSAARTRTSGLIGRGKVKEKQPRIEAVWIFPRQQIACQQEMFPVGG